MIVFELIQRIKPQNSYIYIYIYINISVSVTKLRKHGPAADAILLFIKFKELVYILSWLNMNLK